METLEQVCLLRAASARGQLEGKYPSTLRARQEAPGAGVDTSGIELEALGDFEDLRSAKPRQDAALAAVLQGGE